MSGRRVVSRPGDREDAQWRRRWSSEYGSRNMQAYRSLSLNARIASAFAAAVVCVALLGGELWLFATALANGECARAQAKAPVRTTVFVVTAAKRPS